MSTTSKVIAAISADVTGTAHLMAFGGVFVADVQRFTGTLTATLQMSLDADTWQTFFGADGQARTISLDGTTPSVRWEELGQPGQLFRVAITNATGDTGYYSYGRTAAN